MMDRSSSDKTFHQIAQQRAQQFKKIRQGSKVTRARSQDGQPVSYQKVKEKANINRRSRVMSDPDIPGSLVILNAKGLFQGKNVNVSKSNTEMSTVPISIMNEETSRPVFFDPSIDHKESVTTKVSDLKKRFEAVQSDIVGDKIHSGGEFLNPLHKISQDLALKTSNKSRKDVRKKLEKVLSTEPIEGESAGRKGTEGDFISHLHKANQELDSNTSNNLKNNVQTKLEMVFCTEHKEHDMTRDTDVNQDLSLNTDQISKKDEKRKIENNLSNSADEITKQSTSAQTANSGVTVTTSTLVVKEPSIRFTPPQRPPPRPPKKPDYLKRYRGESDPMPLDENRMSRIVHVHEQDLCIEEIVQEGDLPQQSSESEDVVNVNNESNNGDNEDDDDDDDEWDTDFEDDDDDEEGRLKRDSQSSHGSSCDAEPLEFPDAVSKKLYNIASEILSTERAYVRRLHLLDQVFYLRLNNECCAKGALPVEALNDIFSNIQAIHQLHRDFLLPKLEARMKEWSTNNRIGDILKGLAPFLKMYTLYVGNFDKATETLSTWMKKSPAMAAVIDEIQKSKECENLTLQHHMLEPVQRVPRYQLLLKDYVSKLPEDSEDLKNTSDALVIISESARHANDSMKKTERFKILLDIQERIGVDYPIIAASRELVMEGEFRKVAARTTDIFQERTLMLFNDVLLCCAKFPGANKYKVKVEMDLYGMKVDSVDEEIEMENAFRITSKQRVMDFTAATPEAKETFINKLEATVNELTFKRESYRRASKIELMQDEHLGKKAPAWVRDEAVSMCMLCDVMFTKFRRRHHCRACGRVVCGHCSSFKATLEYKNGKMEKVCEVCHRILVTGSSEEKAKEAVTKGNSILKIGAESKILHSGYMSFKMKGERGWQKRWFVLSSDFVLFRYKAKKDTKAEFNLPLPGHNVDKPTLADEVDRKNVFKLHHKNVRVYLFQAQNEESMNRWMELLTQATKAEEIDENHLQVKTTLHRANST